MLIYLLINKEIKVEGKSVGLQKYGYADFYVNDKLKRKYDCCESYNSKYSGLVGKVFRVLSVQSYKNSIGVVKYKLKIENPEIGIIYFNYSPKYQHSFPFEILSDLDLPDDYYCKYIKTTTDKFTGDITSRSVISEGITLMKVTKDDSSKIYMSIKEYGSTLTVGKEGLILLLENGQKISRPNAKVDVEANKNGYTYSVFIELTEPEIQLIMGNNITDNRLYIYDGQIKDGAKLSAYLECLTK